MGRSLQPTVTTQPLLPCVPPTAKNTPPFSCGLRGPIPAHSPPKAFIGPLASTLTGGSSLAFPPLHSLPHTAARGLFLKGKADLVPALLRFFHEQHQEQSTRVLEASAQVQIPAELIRGECMQVTSPRVLTPTLQGF